MLYTEAGFLGHLELLVHQLGRDERAVDSACIATCPISACCADTLHPHGHHL